MFNKSIFHSLGFTFVLLISYLFNNAYAFPNNKHIKAYTDTGKGAPIILIHAFPTDQRLWQPQRAGLKDYFRVITVDLPGFGEAHAVKGQAISMTEYAGYVKRLLDQLHIHKAIVGGESMGGYIALAFLEKYPQSVSGLILSDTQSIADPEPVKIKRETSAVDILQNGTSTFIAGFLPKALSQNASTEVQQTLKDIVQSQSPQALASALRGMALRHDTSNVLAATQLPVLIITGEQDTLISPKQSEAMQALAKNSQLVSIENAGHLSSLEKPIDWNNAVIRFFRDKQ